MSAVAERRSALLLARADRWSRERARLLAGGGLALAIGLALLATSGLVRQPRSYYLREMAVGEDFYRIYTYAGEATWRDVPRWWVGPWVYRHVGYYRPVTSTLFLVERHVFGQAFDSYNRVTWLIHGANAGLVYLLVVGLARARRRLRVPLGLVAAYTFSVPDQHFGFAVIAALEWWPAQNDPLALLFGLSSLVMLEHCLHARRRAWCVASLLALVLAIGAKEMGHAAAMMAVMLIWYRERGIKWLMAPFAAVSAGFYLLRLMVVPDPWPFQPTLEGVWRKLCTHVLTPVAGDIHSGLAWYLVPAAGTLVLAVLALRYRWPLWKTAAACIALSAACAQFAGQGGTWALLLEPSVVTQLRGEMLFLGAAALLWWRRREGLSALAVAWYLTAFIPIAGVVGTFYYYWAAACRGILISVVFWHACEYAETLRREWRSAPPTLPPAPRRTPAPS